nr:integrase, catalytic region, zinc finger, CCHC-type, peptidase aspartic, catalytic [Tanacetum cinerariifolium]
MIMMKRISLSFKKIYKPTNNILRTSSNTSRANQDNSLRIHRNTGYESQRSGNVAGARETVGSSMVQKSGIQCYNCKEYGHIARECQKPRKAKDAAYHREKMLLYRPPMLAPGNYVQWKSRIKRYIDTKPNHELIHYCLKNPPYKLSWADKTVPVFEGSPETTTVRSQQAATRNRGKAIVNSPQPIYDQESSMVAEDDELSKDMEIDKLMALISLSFKKIYKPTNNNLRTSSNTSRANHDNSPRINKGAGYDNQRLGNVAGARETIGTPVVQKYGIQCYNCKEFWHVARECQKPKRAKDAAYHREKMLLCKQEEAGIQLNEEQADWRDDTDDESEDQELEAHYMYMEKLQEVTPDAAESSRPIFDTEPLEKVSTNDNYNVFAIGSEHLEQSKSIHDTYLIEQDEHNVLVEKLKGEIEDFKNKNISLESSNNRFKEANNTLPETNKLLYNDFKKSQAELERHNNVEYASKVEIDWAKAKGDLISYKMESQNSFNKYTQTINDLNQTIFEMKEKLFAHQETISILSQAKEAHIKLYKTRKDKKLDKVIALENKVKEMVADLRYFNSLELKVDSLRSQLKSQKTQFLNEIDRISSEYYYAHHMNAIIGVYTKLDEVTNLQCDYLELLEKCECLEKELSKSKMMSKSFEALQQHTVNLELDLQQYSLERKDFSKSKSVIQNNVSNAFSKPVITQILPLNKKSILKNTNVLAPGMYKLHTEPTQTRTSQLPNDYRKTNKRVSFSTGVIPTTSVSRPQLQSNPIEDRVLLNNSQGKKQGVEDYRRNVKFSKNKTTKMPIVVPVSTREPKRTVTQSVAKPLRKTVASESTNQKPRNTFRKLYERVSVPLCQILYCLLILLQLVEIILFIVDSGCSKHMTGNLKLLINFVEKFLGTVKFGNDQIAPILGYGDLVQGAITIKRVYYVEGLNHNLFSIGQFCDADLEVAFRKSTCFIYDLKGNC